VRRREPKPGHGEADAVRRRVVGEAGDVGPLVVTDADGRLETGNPSDDDANALGILHRRDLDEAAAGWGVVEPL
jgi:hypothetical protein